MVNGRNTRGDKIEPSAEIRAMASTLRQLKVALVDEGFSEAEADRILAETLRAAIGSGLGGRRES